jgi:hypothetical protein
MAAKSTVLRAMTIATQRFMSKAATGIGVTAK